MPPPTSRTTVRPCKRCFNHDCLVEFCARPASRRAEPVAQTAGPTGAARRSRHRHPACTGPIPAPACRQKRPGGRCPWQMDATAGRAFAAAAGPDRTARRHTPVRGWHRFDLARGHGRRPAARRADGLEPGQSQRECTLQPHRHGSPERQFIDVAGQRARARRAGLLDAGRNHQHQGPGLLCRRQSRTAGLHPQRTAADGGCLHPQCLSARNRGAGPAGQTQLLDGVAARAVRLEPAGQGDARGSPHRPRCTQPLRPAPLAIGLKLLRRINLAHARLAPERARTTAAHGATFDLEQMLAIRRPACKKPSLNRPNHGM